MYSNGTLQIYAPDITVCPPPTLSFPQVTNFRSYVDMYVKDKMDETGSPLTIIHEVVNNRWEVCLTMSEKGFQQVSFVNSIATTKVGGGEDDKKKKK